MGQLQSLKHLLNDSHVLQDITENRLLQPQLYALLVPTHPQLDSKLLILQIQLLKHAWHVHLDKHVPFQEQ